MEMSATAATTTTSDRRRNAGPNWGYAFLARADRFVPAWLLEPGLKLGTWVAVATMPSERRHSRDYLRQIFQREPTLREIWKHFFTFTEMFMLRLRIAEGRPHRCRALPSCDEFSALMASGRPALLGTFHFGNSDLLGFLLGEFKRHVHMVRLRVENSRDTARLYRQFGEWVTFIWVNDHRNLLFALKEAAQSGGSIALKCDRPDYSAKLEPFQFLGAQRMFPFTIYHLALMFDQPVVLCVSVPGAEDESLVHSSPVFEPGHRSKEENLARARAHFQDFLTHLETLLRENPYVWFNFTPLNPVALPATPGRVESVRPATLSC
jgi:predicted LPLAT superfamily acyltransferase